ncbi:hypothetical protein [Sphingomonas sp.]
MNHGSDNATQATGQGNIGHPASTLVVRAWLEPGPGNKLVLRGTVAELGGRMLGAFGSLDRLAALVAVHLARKDQPSDP